MKNFLIPFFPDGALGIPSKGILTRGIFTKGILTKGSLGHKEPLLRPTMDPELSYQILVTGFAKERAGVQSRAVVSYHSGGKPGLSYREC